MQVSRFARAVAVAGVVLAAIAPAAVAQTGQPARPAQDLLDARRALHEGRYGEVEALLRGAPAEDADRAALRARAAEAVGRDAEAEVLLRPAAVSHPTSEAALELGLLLVRLGRRPDAARVLSPLVLPPDSLTPAELVRAGRAARALGEFKVANDLLREAAGQAREDDGDANTAWGELFLEKYNRDEAKRCFEAALHADGRRVDAWLGLARAVTDDDYASALASVRRALEINPASVDAHVLLAELLLDAGYEGEAQESLNRALAVNPRSVDAHALVAAIARLQNRTADFEAAIERALAVNRTNGEAYRLVAAQLASHYRFDEATELARKAVSLDPANSRARAELGMDLLRIGDEEQALATLRQAFEADPYDVVTYNLLAVLDALADFETFRDGDIVLRLDRKEAAVLKEPVLALARQALGTLSARYGFTPRGPILIEVFAHHDDFAVRNLGIPGLVGALGACFGRVVTMDSPRARPPGTFEWGATLWHELTHVITLQMSNQRIPRWLTEGISVYEEQRGRAEWRRPMEEVFARALDRQQVPALRDIDASFADPKSMAFAYYHAALIVGYIVEAYGQDKLNALVRSFGDGLNADAAFSRALGANLEQVQAGFARSLDKSFGPLRRALHWPLPGVPTSNRDELAQMPAEQLEKLASAHPDSYYLQLALGQARRREGDEQGAKRALVRAAGLFPRATGSDSAHAVLAEMAVESGDQAAALREMDEQLAQDTVNIELARRMAGLMGPDDDRARRHHVYERIASLDPFDADAHGALGKLAAERQDGAGAIREFKAALAAGASDAPGVRCDLAEAYLLAGDAPGAKRETLAVLEQAPMFERAQELLLKLVEGGR